MSTVGNTPIVLTPSTQAWEKTRFQSRAELLAKKVIFAVVVIFNISVLAGGCAYVILYAPIPNSALVASPFITGALMAISLLKLPTFKVNSMNYTSFTNPTTMVGYATTLLLFGPIVYLENNIDWINYGNANECDVLSTRLKTDALPEAMSLLRNSHNLYNYHFIDTIENRNKIRDIYNGYKARQAALQTFGATLPSVGQSPKALKREEGGSSSDAKETSRKSIEVIQKEMSQLEAEWSTIQTQLDPPRPEKLNDTTTQFGRIRQEFHCFVV